MSIRKIPTIGDCYYNLTLIECLEPSNGDSNNGGKWKYLCKCGNSGTVNGYRWSGSRCIKSCGCLNGQIVAEANKKRRNPQKASINLSFTLYEHSTRNRGLSCLTREEWEKIVFLPCHYCGEIDERQRSPSRKPKNKYSELTKEEENEYTLSINGIDRIDRTKGYIEGNCVPCCRMCNIMKNGYSVEELKQRVKRIYEYHHLQNMEIKPVCYSTSYSK